MCWMDYIGKLLSTQNDIEFHRLAAHTKNVSDSLSFFLALCVSKMKNKIKRLFFYEKMSAFIIQKLTRGRGRAKKERMQCFVIHREHIDSFSTYTHCFITSRRCSNQYVFFLSHATDFSTFCEIDYTTLFSFTFRRFGYLLLFFKDNKIDGKR